MQADERVALPDPMGPEDLVPLHDTHGESDRVERARPHDAGVLGHLAAEQRGAHLAAALGHPAHQLGHPIRIDPADRQVVEEEQRLGPLADEVVHAHGHQVDPDGVEATGRFGHQCLGAHPVGGSDQHGMAVARRLQGEQPAEPAELAHDFGATGRGDQGTDAVDSTFTRPDVDPGSGVGGTSGLGASHTAGVGASHTSGVGASHTSGVGAGGLLAAGRGHVRPPTAPLRVARSTTRTGTGTG